MGQAGPVPFTHAGRNQTDLPEDCAAIQEIVQAVQLADRRPDALCSDETLTLPDLVGVWDNE